MVYNGGVFLGINDNVIFVILNSIQDLFNRIMSDKIQFTQEGFDNLQTEHDDLVGPRRDKAVKRLALARSMGDLSENSEYQAAKEELAFVEGRIQEIEELIKKAEIMTSTPDSGVTVGTSIIVEKDGKEESYSIVGEFEANPLDKKLSSTSPIGKAFLGKKEGEIVIVEVPAGKLKYKILKIKK